MGLFGGAATTTTKVRPAWQTEQILRDVVNRSNQAAQNQHFIGHEMAPMTSDYQGALAQLAASPELQRAASDLTGRTTTGLENLSASNQAYQNILNNPVTARAVQDFSKGMTSPTSLSSRALSQGTNAGGAVSGLGGSAALRSAGRFNTSNINATMANQRGQQMNNLGINTMLGNQRYAGNVAGMQSNLGGTNIGLGGTGVQIGQQALQNQLQAGNLQQQYQQALNQNQWQNSMGSQMFDWNQLNNRLNVLNQVSPMAGYTAKNTTAAPSQVAQLYGAGMTGLGIYGKLGGFNGTDEYNTVGNEGGIPVNQYKNQWYNQGGTGVFNGLGRMFGGGS